MPVLTGHERKLYFVIQCEDSYRSAIEAAVSSLLPGARFFRRAREVIELASSPFRFYELQVQVENRFPVVVRATLSEVERESAESSPVGQYLRPLITWQERDEEILDERYTLADRNRRVIERVRKAVYVVIQRAGLAPVGPWGTLVGVRPTKLVHRLLDLGFSAEEIARRLPELYGMETGKAHLLTGVASRQRAFLPEVQEARKQVSVYVGIPFCPTRCAYCSFAAYSLQTHGHFVEDFFAALIKEIQVVGRWFRERGLVAESIYIGGGTPTVLNSEQLERLGRELGEAFYSQETREFTCEAGRPDTITREKLAVLREAGVNRLSINCQTMQEKTLRLIGRSHSVTAVYDAFALARGAGFDWINTDIIIALPGETMADVADTIAQVETLAPENLTVHSLAVKRAARWRSQLAQLALPGLEESREMLETVADRASSWGMQPYYLYRQRYIMGNLENVGYALPGRESIYNIQIMEERQSVLGLGGGGITKLVEPGSWRLSRLVNPKCPATYVRQLPARLREKLQRLREHFGSPLSATG